MFILYLYFIPDNAVTYVFLVISQILSLRFESHCFQHLSKLSLGIRLCSIDIGAVEATFLHGLISTLIHSLSVAACPFAFFKETLGLRFVNEVMVQQFDRR